MNPFDQAAKLYEEHPQPRSFGEDIAAHLKTGHVILRPDAFVVGRAVDSSAPWEELSDPWRAFPRERQDGWLVWVAAGNVNTCLQCMPYSLRWLLFARRGGVLKRYEFSTLSRKLAASRGATAAIRWGFLEGSQAGKDQHAADSGGQDS